MLYRAAVIHLEVVLAVLVVLAEVDPYRAINLIASAGVLVQHQVTNCIGSAGLFPSSTNCANPTVLHPANAPNTAVAQPSNCNVPTSVHTNTPKNIVVHPVTTNCANPNIVHPTNAPNTAVVQPSNCNVPTSVHHTNAPSTVVVRPSNCPPPSPGSSNSITVNNVKLQ